ncbi:MULTISPECIES: hypothetical protein [Mycobacteriales]|uniref:Uncharacterized protein n=1 Tax=Gordonia amicalis TaxID=89053 RepID=A0AAE4R2E5_9ACTN|nr:MULTISPECIES: hypothetical protein [Mycobacteriales]KHJ71261.1 hypothetical protein QR64_18060 [Rhodococcus sp. Chr-9]MDV6312110.1 hypothetical protein [Gordonia amicalis]HNP55905.1 hypothetical protein [Gordonia sp. (in: high G+C Gram-positive bacteria)]HRC51846.1 hypothetical protein [Gordonia sp. (in: high G+C Gram-positive bacteria)]
MTSPIAITVYITNSYPVFGRAFMRDEVVTVDAPMAAVMAEPDSLADWAQDQLMDLTGEGPDYSAVHGVYEIVVTAASVGYKALVGLAAYAEG